jgi:hypothetical protein
MEAAVNHLLERHRAAGTELVGPYNLTTAHHYRHLRLATISCYPEFLIPDWKLVFLV